MKTGGQSGQNLCGTVLSQNKFYADKIYPAQCKRMKRIRMKRGYATNVLLVIVDTETMKVANHSELGPPMKEGGGGSPILL